MIAKINGIPITTQFHAIDAAHKTPHQGIDLALPMDTPVHSVGYGIVTGVTDDGNMSFGKSIHMRMANGNDVVYAHLDQPNVHVGQFVEKGDVIGLSGNTGHSTGPHLHLQVMSNGVPIDPSRYLPSVMDSHIYPWWDFTGRAKGTIQHHMVEWMNYAIHGMYIGLETILPTAAAIGILWWMCPFFPKSDKAPRLTGTALILFMFVELVKGTYGI